MLIKDDCLKAMTAMSENSIDSLITDPPAGISFMGKAWDKGHNFIPEMTEIYKECLRVLKPGAHGLVWAIPRTSHWTATALEQAGFEVRDVITHLFGSGFPKSQNIALAIDKQSGVIGDRGAAFRTAGAGDREDIKDKNGVAGMAYLEPITSSAKQWQGWGTALKPASEHWILVRKPISEPTVAKNVLKWGVGGINIDACRVSNAGYSSGGKNQGIGVRQTPGEEHDRCDGSMGRFPANLILDEVAAEMLDEQSGLLKQGGAQKGSIIKNKGTALFGNGAKIELKSSSIGEAPAGASRFFYCAKASKRERNEGLEGMPMQTRNTTTGATRPNQPARLGADPHAETKPEHNNHPTVKPLKLMEYLITLITPPNGTVLDPFMGSGSTGVAAKRLGFGFVGIEREQEYFEIAEKRIG